MRLKSFRENEFEHFIDRIADIHRVEACDWPFLTSLLSVEDDVDSYSTSSMYYRFTGRRRIWVYKQRGTYLLFCWHPNLSNTILVFPPRGNQDIDLVVELLKSIDFDAIEFRLARFKLEDIRYLERSIGLANNLAISHVTEEILDWRFPVRILSTTDTAKAMGHNYMLIRNRLRQTKKYSVEIFMATSSDEEDILSLTYRWASSSASSDTLINPYKEMIKSLKDKNNNTSGLLFKVEGQIEGAILWDISNIKSPTANIHMNLCNISFKGLSELALVTTAQHLEKNDVPLMNLGGSESESLDNYKRKFIPVLSVDLHSATAMKSPSKIFKSCFADEVFRKSA